jgi:DNA-binding NarL/FixJ family response regulator
VLLVDDHEVVIAGIRTLLRAAPHIAVVGEAGTAGQAIDQAARLRPDVVLLDLELPDMSGVEACREIVEQQAARAVLFLTSHSAEESMLAAFFAGASGYLIKNIGGAALIEAIEAAAAGRPLTEPQVSAVLRQRMQEMSQPAKPARPELDALSPQEARILALVVEGKTNKEIAVALGLAGNTVKNYLSNTFQKLRVNRRAEAAARYALTLQRKRA